MAAVGNSSSASVNSASIEWVHVLGTGSDLVLMVGLTLAAGVTASAVAWDNDGVNEALTLLRRDDNTGAGVSEIWYLVGPSAATGSSNVTASVSSMSRNIGGAVTFTGATTPDNETGSTPDGVSSVSNTVSGVGADDFVFDCARFLGTLPSAGPDQTEQWNIEVGGGGGSHGAASTQDGVDGGVMSWDCFADIAHTACRIPNAGGAPPDVSLPPIQPPMRRPLPHVRM